MTYTHGADQLTHLALLTPDNRAAGTYDSAIVDLAHYPLVRFAVLVGAYSAAGATLQAQVYVNTTNSTSGAVAVTGKTFAPSSFSGSAAGANNAGDIWLRGEEAGAALANARYAFLRLTIAGGSIYTAGEIAGLAARYVPGSNAATLKERVD